MAVTNLRVVCKIITCVTTFTFTEVEMAILIFLEIVKAAAKLLLQIWTQDYLACWTRTRHDFFTYVSQRAESKAATVTISLGSFTVAGDFMLQLIRLESLGSELEEN